MATAPRLTSVKKGISTSTGVARANSGDQRQALEKRRQILAQREGRSPENGLHLPTGVWIEDNQLLVADAWNHRVLVWTEMPQSNDTPPSYAFAQSSLFLREPNRGCDVDAYSLYWPYGISVSVGWLYITDTGNRRVLGWPRFPEPDEPAAMVLGQASGRENRENRDGAVNARSFRWPHAVAGSRQALDVADAGNHRVLGWTPRPLQDGDANMLLGQPHLASNSELPHGPQGPGKLRFPYAITAERNLSAVADTANNRVLLWRELPTSTSNVAADLVLGQDDLDANGENRWDAVAADTLCWPYGIDLHRGQLAIADSGNNRVMIWNCSRLVEN